MNVIFIPYCNFATSGLSLLYGCKQAIWGGEGLCVHERKHLSADGKGERENEEHEKCHLCYEQ